MFQTVTDLMDSDTVIKTLKLSCVHIIIKILFNFHINLTLKFRSIFKNLVKVPNSWLRLKFFIFNENHFKLVFENKRDSMKNINLNARIPIEIGERLKFFCKPLSSFNVRSYGNY